MADNTKESTRPLGPKPLPTRLIVNTDTGAADLYSDEGVFGRTLIAQGSATGDNWTIKEEFVEKYNTRNGTSLTPDEFNAKFKEDFQPTINKDRSNIINIHSTPDVKTRLSKDSKIPGVIDPVTNTKPNETAGTSTSPEAKDQLNNESTPAKPEKIDATPIEASGARSGANSYGDHVYPESLRASTQDKVKFTMVEYKPKSFDPESFEFKPTTQKETILGSVILPIPSGISESNQAVWGENELNAAEAAAASVALKAIGEGLEAGGQEASAYFQSVQEKSKDVIKGITNAFGAAAAGVSGAGLLSRTTGAVINSNLELLFNRPSLRPFSFTFKMSARNENEARSIIRIIKFFKQGMSPQKSKSNIFLKSPNIFKIEYLHRNETHPYIGQIKECALQSCTVNYTPEGQYATFYDGVLVSYEIQMQFTELEPVFNDDYGSSGDLSADLLFKK